MDMWESLLKESKKQTFYARILAGAACGLLAAVLFFLSSALPKALRLMEDADEAVGQVESTVKKADAAIDSINSAGLEMERFLSDNSSTAAEAMEKIGSIDFDELNRAIKDLGDVVEPLAGLANKFKR